MANTYVLPAHHLEAFNPIWLEAEASQGEELANIVIAVYHYDGSIWSGTPVDTVTFELVKDKNNRAVVDLSGVLRSYFIDNAKVQADDKMILNNLFVVRYTINGSPEYYYAYNGVRQWLRGSSITGDGIDTDPQYYYSNILSVKPSYSVYDGYPFDVCVFTQSDEEGELDINNTLFATIEGQCSYSSSNLLVNDIFPAIVNISLSSSSPTLTLTKGCVDEDSAFYIRWINNRAGWEHAMFQKSIVREQEVSDVLSIQKYVPYKGSEGDTQQTLNATVVDVVTAGAGGLSGDDFRWLQGIARSPRIELYDVVSKRWSVIVINDEVTSMIDSSTGLHSIEMAFRMPRILTQF